MENHQIFHIVAASGDQMVIGNNNDLPWPKFSSDLKHFRTTTAGSTVIMGRHTFESIGNKPLPNRQNIVLSHGQIPVPDGVTLCNSFDEAIEKANQEKIFVIGGGEIFKQTIDKVDQIIMTYIPMEYPGNVYYPQIPEYFKKIQSESLPTLPDEPKAERVFYINSKKYPR